MEYQGAALLVCLEYVPKSFANKVEQLEIRGRTEFIKMTDSVKMARILK